MNVFKEYSVVLLVFLSLSASLCWCQCPHRFVLQPDTVAGSPIGCNILGARVEIQCLITGSVEIGWFFTTMRSRAGDGVTDDRITDTNRYLILPAVRPSNVSTPLVIRSYDNTYKGFYWCGVVQAQSTGTFNPSRVVELETTFTTAELQTCAPSPVVLSGSTARCALGEPEVPPTIVLGAGFINFTIITTEAPTTEATPAEEITTLITTEEKPTTPPTRTTDQTTTTEEGSSSSNIARTAIIWFSVGAVAFVLITCGVVLCVVALIKC
jgi:hypothetical protein